MFKLVLCAVCVAIAFSDITTPEASRGLNKNIGKLGNQDPRHIIMEEEEPAKRPKPNRRSTEGNHPQENVPKSKSTPATNSITPHASTWWIWIVGAIALLMVCGAVGVCFCYRRKRLQDERKLVDERNFAPYLPCTDLCFADNSEGHHASCANFSGNGYSTPPTLA